MNIEGMNPVGHFFKNRGRYFAAVQRIIAAKPGIVDSRQNRDIWGYLPGNSR